MVRIFPRESPRRVVFFSASSPLIAENSSPRISWPCMGVMGDMYVRSDHVGDVCYHFAWRINRQDAKTAKEVLGAEFAWIPWREDGSRK